jgi:spore maturation protein CgeB
MRIFIPSLFDEDSFVDNVQATLRQMGHEVQTLGAVDHKSYWSLPRYALRVAVGRAFGDRPTPLERKVVREARNFKPDVVLGLTAGLHPETVEALGKVCGGRRVLWWGDPPANSRRWGILDPGWDVVFLKDKVAVGKLKMAGRNAHLLHEAMNPTWHRPLASQSHDKVAVAGNYYAFRQAMVLRLMGDGVAFALYGPRPPRWAEGRIKATHSGRYLMREEKSRAFGEAMACLNTFPLAEADSLNCRAFEIAGAGGLQLIEYRPAVEECFEPGKELLTFSTYEELLVHIDRARNAPKEMAAVRQAGARRALSEHTYEHRVRRILSMVDGKLAM